MHDHDHQPPPHRDIWHNCATEESMRVLILGIMVVIGASAYAKATGEDALDAFNDGLVAYDKGNYQTAARLYQKACNLGNALGCKS